MTYASVGALRDYLGQVASTGTREAQLSSVLERANSIVNDALGFSFAEYGVEATEREVLSTGGPWLVPPAYKAGSIESVASISSRGTTAETETAITDYIADEDIRPYRLYRDAGWTRDTWYRVTAIWGYGEAPDSVIEVELEVAVNIWRSAQGSSFGTTVGVDGSGAVTVNRALTWAQRSILDGVRMSYLGVVHG